MSKQITVAANNQDVDSCQKEWKPIKHQSKKDTQTEMTSELHLNK